MEKNQWTIYHSRLHQTLKKRQLLPSKSRILIALSGGQDSLCLTRLCLDLQHKWQWQCAIAHFDHGWELDQGLSLHIEEICLNWGVTFFGAKTSKNIKETEAEARKHRYQALIDLATTHNFNYIVTGHTLSDRSETFIYNLIRGAGIEGITALNWTRKLGENLTLVRPILNFTRKETGDFCQQLNLPIWEDKYNENKQFARNRIRLELIPYLEKEFNGKIQQHLAQTAEILRGDLEYLERETNKLYFLAFDEEKNSLKRSQLNSQPLNLQRRVIKKFLQTQGLKMPNFEQIESLVNLIHAPNNTQTSSFSENIIFKVEDDLILQAKISSHA